MHIIFLPQSAIWISQNDINQSLQIKMRPATEVRNPGDILVLAVSLTLHTQSIFTFCWSRHLPRTSPTCRLLSISTSSPPLDTAMFYLISTLEPSKQNSLKIIHCVFNGFLLNLKPNPSSSSWPGMCCVIQPLPDVPPSLCAPFPFLSQLWSAWPSFLTREARLSPSSLLNLGSSYSYFHSWPAVSF